MRGNKFIEANVCAATTYGILLSLECLDVTIQNE